MANARFVVVLSLLAGSVLSNAAWSQTPPPRTDPPDRAADAPDPDELADKALELIDRGALQEADEILQGLKRFRPTMHRIKLLQGLLWLKGGSGRGPEANRVLESYNRTDTGKLDYRGFAAVGLLKQQSRMWRQARRALKSAVELAPTEENGKPVRANILLDLATVELRLAETNRSPSANDAALEYAREAVRRSPDDAIILLRFAQILANASDGDDYSEAIRAGRGAIRRVGAELRGDPFNRETLGLLRAGYSLISQIHRNQAKRNPDNAEHIIAIAEDIQSLSMINRRLALFDSYELVNQALDMAPRPAWQLMAARLEVDVGGAAGAPSALERIQKILEDEPDNQDAKNLRTRIEAMTASPAGS